MSRQSITLQIADDGTLTIPVALIRALRLVPRQTVTIEVRDNILVLEPSRKERLNRIGRLLRSALVGVEWSEIEAGRRDRCF